jgi:hypothetical protein
MIKQHPQRFNELVCRERVAEQRNAPVAKLLRVVVPINKSTAGVPTVRLRA